jgi:hypothetical protein
VRCIHEWSVIPAPVAQSCTLPYRRFEIGCVSGLLNAPGHAEAQQDAILRYSRFQICATGHRQLVDALPGVGASPNEEVRVAL